MVRARVGMADLPSLPSAHHAISTQSHDGPCFAFGLENHREDNCKNRSMNKERWGLRWGIHSNRNGTAFGPIARTAATASLGAPSNSSMRPTLVTQWLRVFPW